MALPRSLIDPKLIYLEPAVRAYPRGRKVLARSPMPTRPNILLTEKIRRPHCKNSNRAFPDACANVRSALYRRRFVRPANILKAEQKHRLSVTVSWPALFGHARFL